MINLRGDKGIACGQNLLKKGPQADQLYQIILLYYSVLLLANSTKK